MLRTWFGPTCIIFHVIIKRKDLNPPKYMIKLIVDLNLFIFIKIYSTPDKELIYQSVMTLHACVFLHHLY